MGTPQSGRLMRIEVEDPDNAGTFIPVAGARENTFTWENGEIDNSDKDSEYRQLGEGGTRQFNTSVTGLYENDDAGAQEFFDRARNNRIETMRLVWKNGEQLEGPMQIGSYERTGTHQESTTFSCEIKSAGEPTYTEPTFA